MKNEILKIVKSGDGYNKRRLTESFFKKNHIKLYRNILSKSIKSNVSFNVMLYLIINNMLEPPVCVMCGKPVRYKKFSEGFSKYCSMTCIGKDKSVQEKRENTSLKSIGVKYTLQSKSKRDEIRETCLAKYGVEHPQQLDSVKNKTKETNLVKYGVEHHLKLQTQLEKRNETCLIKYGVKNPMQYSKTIEKSKRTKKERYGDENYINEPKQRETNLKRYGVEYTFNDNYVKRKIKETNKLRYGTVIPSQNNIIKEKIRTSNLKTKRKSTKKYWSGKLGITLNDITFNDDNEIIITNFCEKHPTFTMNKSLLKNRLRYGIENICTHCNPISEHSSIKENEVRDFINYELNIETKKIRINNKELDIYIQENKFAIEFDGLYWHSEIYKDEKYHLNKTELCEEQSIQLLHVFEDEWVYKKEIVKSVIKSKLGIIENKIYGRKTEIKEINDNSLIREFLETNHLQGFVGGKVKIGLFYENELVSLMTFGKKRIAMGNKTNIKGDYEMLRYCNKLNTQVIGGASKLLKYFVKTYQPKSILTFADRRYSNGDLYKQLGFEFIGNTKPNYWYYNNKTKEIKKHYRFGFRKDVLIREGFDSYKTEKEIMLERGYLKI